MTVSREQFTDRFFRALEVNGDTLGTPDALKPYMQTAIADTFYALTEEMLRVNEHMNLTAITEINEILVKHYADCALIAPYLPEGASMCDVGTGGGFPSLPIAILRPDITILGVDSTQKKLDYVANTAKLLVKADVSNPKTINIATAPRTIITTGNLIVSLFSPLA